MEFFFGVIAGIVVGIALTVFVIGNLVRG